MYGQNLGLLQVLGWNPNYKNCITEPLGPRPVGSGPWIPDCELTKEIQHVAFW